MKHELTIETWNRKEHYLFFKDFDEPFFGVCVDIDCTKAYQKCKEENYSFFLYYLHKSLMAANRTEPFRYIIENDKVYIYDVIDAAPTIGRADGTFGFAYMKYHEDMALFMKEAKQEVENVQNSTHLIRGVYNENVIHYSSLPWVDFTSFSHARMLSRKDSCPKITFGKMKEKDGKMTMPVAIHVHHALMDGFHVGQFIALFQDLINE
ncbi:chloramphenicol acetyltransferase [Dysgonomonas sp. 25]|uniref:chloramphenicol acetyltransferase n=1 Tax=Dysgonomonas sp. 25 TaxID=2302933 RepID=UPI0013D1BD23|nr:chloramphenicol acetyltransferase [Dysgonomonas sp. 25]NDV67396.1 chloramphenicol acetyltransferase [Dysgonomonas sp. 25]